MMQVIGAIIGAVAALLMCSLLRGPHEYGQAMFGLWGVIILGALLGSIAGAGWGG